MKKILITGGSGFIGTNFINYLSKKKIQILNIDKLSSISTQEKFKKIYFKKNYNFIKYDLKNTSIKEPIESKFFAPIKLIRANEVGNSVRVVLDLKGSVYWKKPWQVKHKDRVDLILEIKRFIL